jgi:FixH
MSVLDLPRHWWLIPVSAITLAAIPNGVLLYCALSRPLAKVDERPYAASALVDRDKAAQAAFAAIGGAVDVGLTHGAVDLTWRGPANGLRTVELLRIADANSDRRQAWVAGDHLRIDGLAPGPWRVRIRQDDALLVDQRCDLP